MRDPTPLKGICRTPIASIPTKNQSSSQVTGYGHDSWKCHSVSKVKVTKALGVA